MNSKHPMPTDHSAAAALQGISAKAAALRHHWRKLLPRERTWIVAVAVLATLALLWWLALAPALQTLGRAGVHHQQLDAQRQTMQSLQTEAAQLKAQPKIGADEARRALEAAVSQQLAASGQLSIVGDRATVTLKGTPAAVLAPWLAQVRSNARALPLEARLVRSQDSNSAARWDGVLVLGLPTH